MEMKKDYTDLLLKDKFTNINPCSNCGTSDSVYFYTGDIHCYSIALCTKCALLENQTIIKDLKNNQAYNEKHCL